MKTKKGRPQVGGRPFLEVVFELFVSQNYFMETFLISQVGAQDVVLVYLKAI